VKFRWLAAFLMAVAVVSLTLALAQSTRHSGKATPTMFAPEVEQGFENAQPPSDAVLDALLTSAEAKDSRDELEGLDREAKRKLFEVVRVDLTGRGEEDYVALGNYPMSGADHHWFWIVQVNEGKARVLLFTQGLTIQLLHKRTNGYRDIKEMWAATGVQIREATGTTDQPTKSRTTIGKTPNHEPHLSKHERMASHIACATVIVP
jgi:hypothetical protein